MRTRHQPIGFRWSALTLFLVALPLLAAWLWDGGLYWELQGFPKGALGDPLVAAHRICGWLIPISFGAVFSYGIAQTEPDVRLAVMGTRDPRRVWFRRWLGSAVMFLLVTMIVTMLLGIWAQESLPRLIGSTVAATLLALVIAFTVASTTGATPGVVALGTAIIVGGLALALPLLGLPPYWSLSPGPLGWLQGALYQASFAVHSAVVVLLAIGLLYVTLYVPRDVRRVRWMARYGGRNA